jgi:hypothetical protein
MQPFDTWLDASVALHFSLTDEVEPDARAVLEDTVPANELQIALTDVALRASVFTVLGPGCLGLVYNHCSSFGRLWLNEVSQTGQLNGANIGLAPGNVNMWITAAGRLLRANQRTVERWK